MRFKLVMTMVSPEITDKVIDSDKKAGATGNVILSARGSGMNETKLFGFSVEDKTNLILFIVEEHSVNKILDAVTKDCKINEPGNGLAVVLSIDKVAGLEKQIGKIKDRLKEENL